MKPKCWLIGNQSERNGPAACARIARLRGLDVEVCTLEGTAWPSLIAARNQLIAVDFEMLARLTMGMRQRLRKLAEDGTTIYIRGALTPGSSYDLQPFSNQRFEFEIKPCDGYEFSRHWMLPAAIAGERVVAPMKLPHAAGLTRCGRALLSSTEQRGHGWPVIFEMEIGGGVVIFDLHPDRGERECDLLADLEEPAARGGTIGALAAVDWAAGRNPATPAAINLVIDDRPINFDYFNLGNLKTFLDSLEARYTNIRTDFAWTPNHTRPDRRYIETLRRYNTGFVWHGFLRHIDHRQILDFDSELEAGIAHVKYISRAYDVRFQPVMIFPFERDSPRAHEVLRRTAFIAKVQCEDGINQAPNFYRLRSLQNDHASNYALSIIYRHSPDSLSRDRMLALATLGMPVIALAHPGDLALRRFSRRDVAAAAYFDSVLEFAAEKSLRAMSLEEIAAEVPLD
jgi:hypothetical protein